ncbi:MAG: DUF2283 domain-containing protein [Mariniphaga sp.]
MVIKYNKESDVIYIQFSDSQVFESEEDKPGVILDYDDHGNIIGIEILHASEKTSLPEGIKYEVA